MSVDPLDQKAALRRSLRAEMARHGTNERQQASVQLCARLRAQLIWREAGAVLFFIPLADEPDIRPLMADALATGKIVALPRYSPTTKTYEICRVSGPVSTLPAGPFGIPEPGPSCPVLDGMQLDLVLVPGVGFTLAGGRLGRGKGYYDRLLTVVPGFKCGVAFDWQLTIDVPMEPHDIRLNCILTPLLWQEVGSQARS